jgi:hypothetical protein
MKCMKIKANGKVCGGKPGACIHDFKPTQLRSAV